MLEILFNKDCSCVEGVVICSLLLSFSDSFKILQAITVVKYNKSEWITVKQFRSGYEVNEK